MFLTREQLEKLSTKRLLKYKNKLMKYHSTSNWDEFTISKESPEWKEVYQNVKSILATREHVER